MHRHWWISATLREFVMWIFTSLSCTISVHWLSDKRTTMRERKREKVSEREGDYMPHKWVYSHISHLTEQRTMKQLENPTPSPPTNLFLLSSIAFLNHHSFVCLSLLSSDCLLSPDLCMVSFAFFWLNLNCHFTFLLCFCIHQFTAPHNFWIHHT